MNTPKPIPDSAMDAITRAVGELSIFDDPPEKNFTPSIVDIRYMRARKNYWKYYELERRAFALKKKWQIKLNYYEKKLRKLR